VVLGYTHGEIAVTAFIFFLIYGAGLLHRAGRAVGRMLSDDGDQKN
jgi:hypothetical protein